MVDDIEEKSEELESEKELSTRDKLENARQNVKILEELFNSDGWKFYENLINEQIELRETINKTQLPDGMDALVKMQGELWELAGLRLGVSVIKGIYEQNSEDLETLKETFAEEQKEIENE